MKYIRFSRSQSIQLDFSGVAASIGKMGKHVGLEDGNEYEALEGICDSTCFECFRVIPKGEHFYNIYNLYDEYTSDNCYCTSGGDIVEDKKAPNFISYRNLQDIRKNHYPSNICKDCFSKLIKEQIPDADTDAMIKRLEDDGYYKKSIGRL